MTTAIIAPLLGFSLHTRMPKPVSMPQEHVTARMLSRRSIRAAALERRSAELARAGYMGTKDLLSLYSNEAYGILVRYPDGWLVRNLDDESQGKRIRPLALFLSPMESQNDASRENINLVIEELSGKIPSLEDYSTSAIARERSVFPSFTLLSSQPLTVNNLPAQQIRFQTRMEDSDSTVVFEQVWFAWNRRMYVWTLATPVESFEEFSLNFHAMLSSIEMSKPGIPVR